MIHQNENYSDVLVIGAGMGGMTAACLLAKVGLKVRVLEASHVPGGCSSSYRRRRYIFESGATTLVGFDEHQPLAILEKMLGIEISKTEITPSMTVHQNGVSIIRYKDREKWIRQAVEIFGHPHGQRKFWETAYRVSDTVWRISGKNNFFPPLTPGDYWQLITRNNPADLPVLRYAFSSVLDVMKRAGADTPAFRKFIDEQLMITTQATAAETPFLFGAAGLTYTNASNFNIEGGLLVMVKQLQKNLENSGGSVEFRKKAVRVTKESSEIFSVETDKGNQYRSHILISNIPIWNLGGIVETAKKSWFVKQSQKYSDAWGAYTMGIVCEDTFDENMTLHHQIHLPEGEAMPLTGSHSVFVSVSAPTDTMRAPEGKRVLNISCHTPTASWFSMGEEYEANKDLVAGFIINLLDEKLPGFSKEQIEYSFASTPVSWQNWVFRKHGRVGGIPQSMSRSLLDWSPAETPERGLFLTGDTVYPGQGIPGVTLSGINVYYRIKKFLKF